LAVLVLRQVPGQLTAGEAGGGWPLIIAVDHDHSSTVHGAHQFINFAN
jgi:hypothetical protein